MKKMFLGISAVLLMLLSCSCYDSTEVDDMIYILAIGIDDSENGYKQYTLQSAVPLNISSGIETGFTSSEKSVTLQNIKVSAENLYAAIDAANQKVTKEINIAHCKLILFSKSLAEKSIESEVKSVIENPDMRPTVLVAVSESTAEDYLNNISSPFELNPARYYDMVFDKDYSPQSFSAHLYDFEKSDVVSVPLIGTDNHISTSVIKHFVQVGTLDNDETIALNILTGDYKNGYLTISAAMPAVNLSQDNYPNIHIDISSETVVTVNLSFYGTPTATIPDSNKFDNEVIKYIKGSCEKLLYKSAKEFNADIANIGRHIRMKFITEQDLEKFNWGKNYKDVRFIVNVDYRTIR